MKALKAIPILAALAAGCSLAHAAADFKIIRLSKADLSDAAPKLVISFTLPSNVNLSSSTSNSAVLDFEALGVQFNHDEAYINASGDSSPTCTDDGTEDANQTHSIGFLQEHDDTNLKNEWATNHLVFSSALLQAGTNYLTICTRSEAGNVGGGSGNLDDVSVRSMALHYHTS